MPRRLQIQVRAAMALLAVTVVGACDDRTTPTGPTEDSAPLLDVIACRADLAAGTLSCKGPTGTPAAGLSLSVIYGGQGTYVQLASDGVSYDEADEFRADVTVKNLITQPIGTPDGTTVTGIKVFFHSGPTVTSTDPPKTAATVTVANADGIGTFTQVDQPYFEYNQMLHSNEISEPKPWQWSVPPLVLTFEFSVLISTDVAHRIAFLSDDPGSLAGNPGVYTAFPDGSDARLVVSGASIPRRPELSPDGLWIAYSSVYGEIGWEIVTVSTIDLSAKRIAVQPADPPFEFAWSPDGLRLAFIVGGSERPAQRIRIVNSDGTNAHDLIANDAEAKSSRISWSPDGSLIAFPLDVIGPDVLAFVNVNTGESWTAIAADEDLAHPSFSHHGDALAFVSFLTPYNDDDIYIWEFDGGCCWQLPIPGQQRMPVWSPEDDALLFESNHDGNWELYQVRGDGTLTNVTQNPAATDYHPSWSWRLGPVTADPPQSASGLARSQRSFGRFGAVRVDVSRSARFPLVQRSIRDKVVTRIPVAQHRRPSQLPPEE